MKLKRATWLAIAATVFSWSASKGVLAQSSRDWSGLTFGEMREFAKNLPRSRGRIQAIRLVPEAAPAGIVLLTLIPQRGWQVLFYIRMPPKHFRLAWSSAILSDKDGISSSSGKELTLVKVGEEQVIQFEGCVTHACPDDFGVLIYSLSEAKVFTAHYQFGQISYTPGLESLENEKYKSYLERRIKERIQVSP